MAKVRAIIKRPDEKYGHVTNISNTLENLQRTVGGYIETVTFDDFTIICNEEGKLRKLEPNMFVGMDMLVGTIIVIGTDKDEFSDLKIDFNIWKRLVDKWGN